MTGVKKLIVPSLAAIAIGGYVPFASEFHVILLLNLCMWVALVQSWNVFSGLSGYISLGHVVFYGIGGYLSAVLWGVVPLPVAILAGGALAGVIALVVGGAVLRVKGPYFVILSFGFAEFVKFASLEIENRSGTPVRMLFGGPDTITIFYYVFALALLSTALLFVVTRSRLGKGLIAISEDETTAATIGIPVRRYKMIAYGLSAVIPAMIGAIIVFRTPFFEVLNIFNPVVSFTIVTMAIIGGRSDWRGPMLGAVFLVVLSETLWSTAPRLYMVLLGTLLILFVLFLPGGMASLLSRERERL